MKRFYDTNALLTLQDKVLDDDDLFYVSSVTLHELDHIKESRNKTEEVRYNARHVAHLLDKNPDRWEMVMYDDTAKKYVELYCISADEESPDVKICACATKINDETGNDLTFISNDINCKNIAKKIFKLNVEGVNEYSEISYKGYKTLSGNTAFINEKMNSLDYKSTFYNNEYLLIYNQDDDEASEMRFINGNFVPLKLPPSRYIKGKNALQRCALDMLFNNDITISAILGGYGSGKTCLAMRMALYWMNEKGTVDKIVGIRTPEGEGKEVGYLPGELNSKVGDFFLPLQDQLDGGEFELESLKQQGKLDMKIPYYCKGLTFNDSIIICDECEDLNEKEIKLIGTRTGANSRIFFSGDYKQSIINTNKDNALVKMCEELKGNPKFGCIYLDEDVRSDTSKLFADLFLKE